MRCIRAIGLIASAAISVAGMSVAGVSAATGEPSAASGATRYARVRRVCPAPHPNAASCFVLELVVSAPGASGAQPYELAAGSSSKGPAGGLTPSDLASAYGFAPTGGSGQTIGIVDAFNDPKIEKDLASFDTHYGLPACTKANGCLERVNQKGAASPLPTADRVGWSVETSLDVETVHSVCPSCKVLLVEATSESLADLAASTDKAVKLGANEVSNSYGAPESEWSAKRQAAYNHPGTVIVASSGDSGYLDWDDLAEYFFTPEMVNAPASLPQVVAVGGTSLKLKTSGARKSESVWNDSGPPSGRRFKQFSAGGGGCSTISTAPSWQQSAPGWSSAKCGSGRLDNDISAVADPYTGFDIYDSYAYEKGFPAGWLTVGGTSLSAPLISGLYALSGGSHGVSYPAATLYTHLGQESALYDVTAGGNGYCDGEAPGPCGEPGVNEELGDVDCEGTTACDAAAGFDGPSGVGAPTGLSAFGGPTQLKPTVVTGAASSIEAASAVLNATVDPNGETVSECRFEYGPTIAYGQSIPCSSSSGSGTSPVAVSATVTGLEAKTLYHFRISATSPAGSSSGKDKRLKTK
jgi:Subtilase family